MAEDFYSEMAGVTAELLAPTSEGGLGQGSIVLVQWTPGAAPANSWEPPNPATPTRTLLAGAARGISKDLIGTDAAPGVAIVASDKQVIVAPWSGTAAPGDMLELDDAPHTILRIDNIPAVGTPAAVRLIVRGGAAAPVEDESA